MTPWKTQEKGKVGSNLGVGSRRESDGREGTGALSVGLMDTAGEERNRNWEVEFWTNMVLPFKWASKAIFYYIEKKGTQGIQVPMYTNL